MVDRVRRVTRSGTEPDAPLAAAARVERAGKAPTTNRLLALQRSAGNTRVARLLGGPLLQRETPNESAESDKVAEIRDKLSWWNPPEKDIIELMSALSPDEVDTVLSDDTLRRQAAGCFTDEEMYRAVRAMNGDPAKSREWLRAEINPSEFVRTAATELDGVKLDPELDKKVTAFVEHLLDNFLVSDDVVFDGIGGVRDAKTAHRNSTAYHIRTGAVTLEALQALEDGRDQDRNLWYRDGWTEADAKANAEAVWNGKIAHEGYPVDDARRLPNGLKEPKRSEHCAGKAMDLTIPWRDGNGWHAEANELVARFGLVRPIPDERWHFELPAAAP